MEGELFRSFLLRVIFGKLLPEEKREYNKSDAEERLRYKLDPYESRYFIR